MSALDIALMTDVDSAACALVGESAKLHPELDSGLPLSLGYMHPE